jgi:hypothetical protein
LGTHGDELLAPKQQRLQGPSVLIRQARHVWRNRLAKCRQDSGTYPIFCV